MGFWRGLAIFICFLCGPPGWILGAILILTDKPVMVCAECGHKVYNTDKWSDICDNEDCSIGRHCLKQLQQDKIKVTKSGKEVFIDIDEE